MVKQLYFTFIIVLSIEAFMDLIIAGYLTFKQKTIDMSDPSTFISVVVAIIGLSLVLLALPSFLVWINIILTQEQLRQQSVFNAWGALYKEIDQQSMYQRIYWLVFLFRRILILAIGLLRENWSEGEKIVCILAF